MHVRQWIPCVSIVAVSTAVLPFLSVNLSDPTVAAGVFPPWWSAHKVISAAGTAGSIVRLGAFSFIVVVRSNDGDVAKSLRAAGSLITLNPIGLAGCFTR
jgi:hypothetical protein